MRVVILPEQIKQGYNSQQESAFASILESNPMVYPTLKAIVREGQIKLIDEVDLPENAILLVTVIDEAAIGTLSLGEQIIAGLHDLRLGRVTEIVTSSDLNKHLDQLFDED